VLYGSSYWSGLLEWFRQAVLAEGKISEIDMGIFHVVDTPQEVLEIMTHSQNSLTELDKLVSDDIRLPS
jgi:predicted Rossmann-fold nucleotide-binding protein